MPEQKKLINIHISDARGNDYCDPQCEHAVEFNKFPQRVICKISGIDLAVDAHGNVKRSVFCKYLMGEEVPDRFWSPYKRDV